MKPLDAVATTGPLGKHDFVEQSVRVTYARQAVGLARCPLAGCWHFSTQPQALRLHLYAAHRFADADALAAAVETFDGHPPLLLPVDGRLVNFRGAVA